MQEKDKFVLDIQAPFPGEYIEPNSVGLEDTPNTLYLLPYWPKNCNEIFAPFTSSFSSVKHSDGDYEFTYVSKKDDNIRIVVVFQYFMNHVIEDADVNAGEIVGNVNLSGGQEKMRVVSITLDSPSFILSKFERTKKFTEGKIIARVLKNL